MMATRKSGNGTSVRAMASVNTSATLLSQVSFVPETGCWEWTGYIEPNGYGRVFIQGKRWRIHRWSYTHHCGPIPEGMVVCHKCDNPRCINPVHLFLGTHADNVMDARRKGRNRNQWPIITPEKVRLMNELSSKGVSKVKIAAILGCSRKTIPKYLA